MKFIKAADLRSKEKQAKTDKEDKIKKEAVKQARSEDRKQKKIRK